MEPLSVLLVDDQQLFREGLALILKQHYSDIELHHAGNGQDALQYLTMHRIDLVLLDIAMPGMNGIEASDYILTHHPTAKILIVTQYSGEAMISHLMTAGVHGFIFKSSAAEEIKEAIHTVLNNEQYLPPSLKSSLLKKLTTNNLPAVTFNKRQAEILIQLKMGRSSKEIAERLSLKENTINSYREEMLHKTKARNVAELISYAYENGMLS